MKCKLIALAAVTAACALALTACGGASNNAVDESHDMTENTAASETIEINKTAWVGDSIMDSMMEYEIIDSDDEHNKVFAKLGVNADAFYSGDLMKELLAYNPDRMYVLLGLNAISDKTSDPYWTTIISSIKSIVTDCLDKNPQMRVYVLGCGPTTSDSEYTPAACEAFDVLLKDMVSEFDGTGSFVHYVDMTPALADESGELKSDYDDGDGCHWSVAGYNAALDYLEEHNSEL